MALARALLLRPRLLLADEPTGNLDTKTGREMHELFFELNRELGMTILIVTHNDELAAQTPRRLRMADGLIVEQEMSRTLAMASRRPLAARASRGCSRSALARAAARADDEPAPSRSDEAARRQVAAPRRDAGADDEKPPTPPRRRPA